MNYFSDSGETLLQKLQGDITSGYTGRHDQQVTLDTTNMQVTFSVEMVTIETVTIETYTKLC